MLIQNGESYANNYARAAAYYLGTCAEMPKGNDRQAAYRLVTGVYSTIADDAKALGLKPVEDVSFAPWEQQAERQKDVKTIRGAMDKVESLIAELYGLVVAGEARADGLRVPEGVARPKRTLAKALASLGVAMRDDVLALPEGCAEGLKELSEISRAHTISITDGPKEDKAYLYFSRCVFDPSGNWQAVAFDKLLRAEGRLIRLCEDLEKRGYARVDCKDGKKISLDYVKRRGGKAGPVKASWADKIHAGIEVTFEELRLEPCFVWLRMPMFKSVLGHVPAFPADTADFLLRHTKTCDGCRYCVQTDKTGTRPLAAVSINGERKCPYYAAFTMNWRTMTEELARDILSTLDAVDKLDL